MDESDPAADLLPTRCPPWKVLDITRHLAATVARFNRLLRQSRDGDLTQEHDKISCPRQESNLRHTV